MPLDRFFGLAQSSQATAGRYVTPSVMTPMIWICLITTPTCLGAAALFRDNYYLCTALAAVGVLPTLVSCGMFVYFGIVRPERLQSEDYQLRQETLQLIIQKGGKIVVDSVSLAAIANPAAPRLETGDDEG